MISQRMKTAYDTIAGQYAKRYQVMPPVLADLAQAFLDRLPSAPTVLDAGCGNGRDMAWFEAQGCHMTGIDLSPGMLAQARPHVSGTLMEMDLTGLDLPLSSFDGIWCMASLLHAPRESAPGVLVSFRSVLKPGGILVLGLQSGAGENWEARGYDDVERYFARYTPEKVRAMLQGSGFAIISIVEHHSSANWLHIIATAHERGTGLA